MPYLIDGHNLIGQLPDIDIADPDDEAQLVLKLRSFAARSRKKITVIFDGGLPAGVSTELSTHSVKVRFASESSSADKLLIQNIRRTKNPRNWTLVSSDLEVIAVAQSCSMEFITAQNFARQLSTVPNKKPDESESKKRNPHLSAEELNEWLRLFGENPEENE